MLKTPVCLSLLPTCNWKVLLYYSYFPNSTEVIGKISFKSYFMAYCQSFPMKIRSRTVYNSDTERAIRKDPTSPLYKRDEQSGVFEQPKSFLIVTKIHSRSPQTWMILFCLPVNNVSLDSSQDIGY